MVLRQRKSTGRIGDVKGIFYKEYLYEEVARKEGSGFLEMSARAKGFAR